MCKNKKRANSNVNFVIKHKLITYRRTEKSPDFLLERGQKYDETRNQESDSLRLYSRQSGGGYTMIFQNLWHSE